MEQYSHGISKLLLKLCIVCATARILCKPSGSCSYISCVGVVASDDVTTAALRTGDVISDVTSVVARGGEEFNVG